MKHIALKYKGVFALMFAEVEDGCRVYREPVPQCFACGSFIMSMEELECPRDVTPTQQVRTFKSTNYWYYSCRFGQTIEMFEEV